MDQLNLRDIPTFIRWQINKVSKILFEGWERRAELAVFLLLVYAARHYGWLIADPELMGVASKALGSMAALCLISIIWWNLPSKSICAVLGWYAFEELQTVACSIMYLENPWPIKPGESMCSARIGFDIGAVGAFAISFLAYKLVDGNGTKR